MRTEEKRNTLLALLRNGQRLSYLDIITKCHTTSPRDLIFKLRKEGHDIRSKRIDTAEGGYYYVFHLE